MVIALLAPLLGGATERWSQGIVFMAIGLLLVVFPPRLSPPRAFLILMAGLFALILTGFLPAGWFEIASWRSGLLESGIVLPATYSPQPWVTLESTLLFAGGAAWISWLAAQEWSPSERSRMARFYSAGVALSALLALLFFHWKTAPSFWLAPMGFGPFPNRNQTGNFLALGGIMALACANQSSRKGAKWWPIWLCAFGVILAALFVNGSRAGILLLMGGAVLWTCALCYFSRSVKWLVIGFSGLTFLGSLFLLFGGHALVRFQSQFLSSSGILEGRGLIFRDALEMIAGNPWFGVGLGNFESVSPFFRRFRVSESSVIHPESDWLWVAAELGWGAVIVLMAIAGVLLYRAWPLEAKTGHRLRAAALIAVIGFILHGFVDVSGHRLGTLLPALLLLGLSLGSSQKREMHRTAPALFRLCGLFLMAVGAIWLIEVRTGGILPGRTGVRWAKKEAFDLKKNRRFADSIARMNQAIAHAPLDWELYFSRASAQAFAGNWMGALGDFRRARRLQPWWPEPALAEGKIWLELNPALAFPVWQEALEQLPADRRPAWFSRMLEFAPTHPELRRKLRPLAAGQPLLELILLRRSTAEESAALIDSILGADPGLKSFSMEQKGAFFEAWSRSGDAAQFALRLRENQEWRKVGWKSLARYHAGAGEYAQACQLAFEQLTPPPVPKPSRIPSIESLQQRVLINPGDFLSIHLLYHAQRNEGDPEAAMMALEEAAAQANCPWYLFYWKALLHAERVEWREAWLALEKGAMHSS
ncbi:MAG: O-antigen ligase family protein [Verrucomicrobiota bacterium]